MNPFKRLDDFHVRPSAYAAMSDEERESLDVARARLKAGESQLWANDVYTVEMHPAAPNASSEWPEMIYLSIKRNDKSTIRDWRQLQEIKNAIVGPEHEAVELFPAESRLVDTANQYHLWVLATPGMRFPFGWTERLVLGPEDVSAIGARQRGFK